MENISKDVGKLISTLTKASNVQVGLFLGLGANIMAVWLKHQKVNDPVYQDGITSILAQMKKQ